jgi:hypothetical protein
VRRLVLGVVVLLLACGRPPLDPATVVDDYLHELGRDPIRAFSRVTPSFQTRHGLRLATDPEVRAWQHRRSRGASAAPAPERPPPTPEEERLAWLAVQGKPGYQTELARLTWQIMDVEWPDDLRALVKTRIELPRGRSFEQIFQLVRASPRAPWRIDQVEQVGVGEDELAAAFVTNPTEATRERLAAHLGVPAD